MRQYINILLIIAMLLPLSMSLNAQERAYPKNGEGITLFLKRFNRNGEAYRKEFIRLNKGKLGKNNSLRLGVKYTLPPLRKKDSSSGNGKPKAVKAGKGREPLFGKAMAEYSVSSQDLRGACFYVVSGHGGPDPGAIGRMGNYELHEDEYAYDIALRLARNLLSRGAKVHIIIQDAKDGIRNQPFLNNSKRETCMGAKIPLGQVARLEQRVNKINSLSNRDKERYKRAIFIHVDSRSRNQRTDVYFYHKAKDPASKRLAKTMKSTFQKKYRRHQPGRGFSGTVDDRNLYVLRHTKPVSVFVELGNIQNRHDQQRITLSNNRQALANWLCEGFSTDYFNYKKNNN